MGRTPVGHELVKLVVEVGVAVVLVTAVAASRRIRGRLATRAPAPVLAATALTALLWLSVVLHLHATASVFSQDRKRGTEARAGLEHCYKESLSGQPLVAGRAAFLDWVKARLPHGARYVVAPYAGPPDGWCVTLTLLPALPSGRPGWTIYMGTVPASVQAQIGRREPHVQVFAPGFALVRDSG